MEELVIYEFQAKQIEDTLRIVYRVLESRKKETSLDRDICASWEMIKNVLNKTPENKVNRF